jgi:hypothetical protein
MQWPYVIDHQDIHIQQCFFPPRFFFRRPRPVPLLCRFRFRCPYRIPFLIIRLILRPILCPMLIHRLCMNIRMNGMVKSVFWAVFAFSFFLFVCVTNLFSLSVVIRTQTNTY